MSEFDDIIDNLLDENINLMANINYTLEEGDKKLENIESKNYYISLYNLKNWNILNRISNIWNRFFYYKEEDKEIQMRKLTQEDFINDNSEINNSNDDLKQNKINHLKYYSNRISDTIDNQNKILKDLSPKIEDSNNKLKINNMFINKINY